MASRNRSIALSEEEAEEYRRACLTLEQAAPVDAVCGRVLCQDIFEAAPLLPRQFADLLIADPPYNQSVVFNRHRARRQPAEAYEAYVESWLQALLPTLKPDASIYVCADWYSSSAVFRALERHLIVRNRITWEREKGRGAQTNWKNAHEDIWFCTVGKEYYFDVEAVKLRRRVIAPYRQDGQPKDWEETADGNFRLTHPSNLWTDITVPFWSMPENTEHPTQKPEKLLAKLILASCPEGGIVLDPFAGVGSSAVAARKLGRRFVAVESDLRYSCLALKRLRLAEEDAGIQGYEDGVFWERNAKRKG